MRKIPLSSEGQSSRIVNLGGQIVKLTTKYNYYAECWTLDIEDSNGELLLAGIVLVPSIDLLKPYVRIKQLIGTFVLVEKNTDDYKSPDLFITNTALVWFAVGEEVITS